MGRAEAADEEVLWSVKGSLDRRAIVVSPSMFFSDGVLAEVCSPLPKLFKKVGQEYAHPGDRQNTFLEEIIG